MGWEVGDLALCVDASPARSLSVSRRENYHGKPLERCRCYTVHKVGPVFAEGQGLSTTDDPSEPWSVSRFVKVTPPKATQDDLADVAALRGETVEAG